MGKTTNIAWTKSTLNLAWGCTKVTRECTNCYMYRMSPALGRDPYQVEILGRYYQPEEYEKYIRKRMRECQDLIFVNSMSDTFHSFIGDIFLDKWFKAFAEFPQKQFQILTKRPERARSYFSSSWKSIPENIWIGTSCGIKEAIPRIEILKKIPARIKFVSIEPLLEDLGEIDFSGIQWAIIGGESDAKAPRPMKEEWVDNLVLQLRKAGTKIFFKQWGGIGGDNAGGNLYKGSILQEMPALKAKEAQ